MELIPIIKIVLVLLAGSVGIILIVSYVFYKIKKSSQPVKEIQKPMTAKQYVSSAHNLKKSQMQPALVAVQMDQAYYLPQRQARQEFHAPKPMLMQRERFQVLNVQNVEERPNHFNSEQKKAFYHPRNSNAVVPAQTALSLFDRYSQSNERLHKLNFNGSL